MKKCYQIDQLEYIALQCPDAGGKAVYRARPYVELFSDGVEYDDVNVCHLAGIYRESLSFPQQEKGDIKIIPNPANDKIDVVLNHALAGICKIEISNTLGAVIFRDDMNCKEKSHSIDTRQFVSRIYVVKLYHNTTFLKIAKLVIER